MDTKTINAEAMSRLPMAFQRSPLVEALFELRFEPTVPTAGDLLPGLLYAQLRDEYPKVQPMPLATVPRQMRNDPNLLHQATHELSAGDRSVRVGDRVVVLSWRTPYPGWEKFKDAIGRVLKTAASTRMIAKLERFSFRYINVIPGPPGEPRLPFLNITVASPNYPFVEDGFHLRFEHREAPYVTIVQVAPNVTGQRAGSPLVGLLVDIDTINSEPSSTFWDDGKELDEAHMRAKTAFFSLVSGPTIERLGPIY